MKIPVLFAALLLLGLATGAQAHEEIFTTNLSHAGENPPDSAGTGTGKVTLNVDTMVMRVEATFSGLNGLTMASHIHCCTTVAGTGSAGVATQTPTFSGFPLGVSAGSFDQTFDMTQASSWNAAYITANGGTVSSAFASFLTGLEGGNAYLNIHTSTNPGGEIRGFLALSPVPEPGSYMMMALGLFALGGLARRRLGR